MPKVLLLQIRDADDRMLGHEVECFQRKLSVYGEVELACYNLLHDIDREPDLDRVDAVMVGGSGRYGCVDNRGEWFGRSLSLFRRLVDEDVPLFCSCFGHQALAVALGGEVVRDVSRRELGTFEITLTPEGLQDPLFTGFPERFDAQLGHNDHVQRLPEGAVLLASSERSPVQCYRLRDRRTYATQFHPELDHRENQERAGGYTEVYTGILGEALFRETPLAIELIPRFLRMVFDQDGSSTGSPRATL